MEGNYQHFFSVFLGSVLYLTSYLYEYRGELDFSSYYHSKINQIILPPTFPTNDSADISLWREVFSLKASNISTFGIGVMDVHTDIFTDPQRQLMRIYNSNQTANTAFDEQKRDVLIWLHDGAWMFGGAEYEDEICYKLAKHTGFVVISASYRLAPEHPYPTPVNDVSQIVQWVHDNIENYGAHQKKIIIGGEGAGGNLAAAFVARNLDLKLVDIEARLSVIGLLLVYPPLALTNDEDPDGSHSEFDDLNGLMTTKQLDWAKAMYRSKAIIKPTDYTFAPLSASPQLLKLFPNTVIILAKHDILRDEGVKLGKTLKQRYVPVDTIVYNTTVYGFFGRSAFALGDVALEQAAEKLRGISEVYPEAYFFDEEETGGALPPFPEEGFP